MSTNESYGMFGFIQKKTPILVRSASSWHDAKYEYKIETIQSAPRFEKPLIEDDKQWHICSLKGTATVQAGEVWIEGDLEEITRLASRGDKYDRGYNQMWALWGMMENRGSLNLSVRLSSKGKTFVYLDSDSEIPLFLIDPSENRQIYYPPLTKALAEANLRVVAIQATQDEFRLFEQRSVRKDPIIEILF